MRGGNGREKTDTKGSDQRDTNKITRKRQTGDKWIRNTDVRGMVR